MDKLDGYFKARQISKCIDLLSVALQLSPLNLDHLQKYMTMTDITMNHQYSEVCYCRL